MVFVNGPTSGARVASEPEGETSTQTLSLGALCGWAQLLGLQCNSGAGFARKCLCSPWAPEPDAKSGSHLGPGSRLGSVPG